VRAPGSGRDQPEVHAADLAPGVLGQDELDDVVHRYDRWPGGPDRVRPVRTVEQVDAFARTGQHDAHLFPPDLLDVFTQARQRRHHLDFTEAVRQLGRV